LKPFISGSVDSNSLTTVPIGYLNIFPTLIAPNDYSTVSMKKYKSALPWCYPLLFSARQPPLQQETVSTLRDCHRTLLRMTSLTSCPGTSPRWYGPISTTTPRESATEVPTFKCATVTKLSDAPTNATRNSLPIGMFSLYFYNIFTRYIKCGIESCYKLGFRSVNRNLDTM